MDQSVLNVCEEGLNTRAVKSRRAYRVKQALEVEIYLTLEVKVSCNRIWKEKKKREIHQKSGNIQPGKMATCTFEAFNKWQNF